MKEERPLQVRASPLARQAYLYVRQAGVAPGPTPAGFSPSTACVSRRWPWAGPQNARWPSTKAWALGTSRSQLVVVCLKCVRQVGLGRVGTVMARDPWRRREAPGTGIVGWRRAR